MYIATYGILVYVAKCVILNTDGQKCTGSQDILLPYSYIQLSAVIITMPGSQSGRLGSKECWAMASLTMVWGEVMVPARVLAIRPGYWGRGGDTPTVLGSSVARAPGQEGRRVITEGYWGMHFWANNTQKELILTKSE